MSHFGETPFTTVAARCGHPELLDVLADGTERLRILRAIVCCADHASHPDIGAREVSDTKHAYISQVSPNNIFSPYARTNNNRYPTNMMQNVARLLQVWVLFVAGYSFGQSTSSSKEVPDSSADIICPAEAIICRGSVACTECLEFLSELKSSTVSSTTTEDCDNVFEFVCGLLDGIGCDLSNVFLLDFTGCLAEEALGCADFDTCDPYFGTIPPTAVATPAPVFETPTPTAADTPFPSVPSSSLQPVDNRGTTSDSCAGAPQYVGLACLGLP